MLFTFKSLSYLLFSFTSSFSPLFLPFFSPYMSFKANPNLSSPFLSFLSQSCRLCSPLHSSLFPLSSPLSGSHSRLIHVHSLGAEPLLAAPALCSVVSHLTSSNQKRANCVSQGIPANMSPGGGKCVEKKSGRESVSAVYVCVLEQGQHTVCYF